MRKHKTLTLIIFLTLGLFNYTSNANSLNIALFLPFDSSSYSEMAESIHNGINDSLNNFNLNSKIERFNETNSLKDNLQTFKKINSKKYDIIIGPLINSSVIQLEKEILNIKQKILLLNSNSALRNQFQNNKNIYIYGFNLEEEVLSIVDEITLKADKIYVVHNNSKISQKILLKFIPKIENYFDLKSQVLEFDKIKKNLKPFKEKLIAQLDEDDDLTIIFFSFLNNQDSRNFRPYLGSKIHFYSTFLINNDRYDKLQKYDLQNAIFYEMPIVFLGDDKLDSIYNTKNIPLNNVLRRFYAVGYDSILIFKAIENKSLGTINGASGIINFRNNFFSRKGNLVKINNGKLKKLAQ